MSTNPRDTTTAAKKSLINDADAGSLSRAQQNDYEFALAGDSHVNVRNTNYDETGHVYTVAVDQETGLPARCTCPADEHHAGPCKHLLACVIREPIMQAVSAVSREKSVAADGGVETETETQLPATEITEHIEPADQGGEKYVRCEGCGREILSKLGGRRKLSHTEDCAHARNDAELSQ